MVPVGIPCAAAAEDVEKVIRDRAIRDQVTRDRRERNESVLRRTFIVHRSRFGEEAAAITASLPAGWKECADAETADVWIDLTGEKEDWCPWILRAYLSGRPCISYSWSSAHRILFGSAGLAIRQPEEAGMILAHFDADKVRSRMMENGRLYARCYGHFFWFNFLARYLAEAGKQAGILRKDIF